MQKLYADTFRWLAIGLLVTFITGFIISSDTSLLIRLLNNPLGYLLPIVVQFGICIFFGFVLKKLSYGTCVFLFLLYSLITGLDIAMLLCIFELGSVISIFFGTAFTFGLIAVIGKYLDIDITKFGTILFVSLLGIIVMSILNIFVFQSDQLALLVSVIGIVIFMGYIIYDLSILEPLSREVGEDKAAIYCAFQLYLDFINLFIRLLEIFGKRRD
jgi:FtsH-binding integral membrane protein